jgi:2-polyprenyl-6-methoxyphenol hydroxylase-like FAD-dependent oxidoreductase
MSGRHAEVAGAGIAGLATATALAQTGWTVRIHERGDEVREIGAGIFVWENALRVLEDLGLYRAVIDGSEAIRHIRSVDERGRSVQDDELPPQVRLYATRRRHLHRTLYQAAIDAGAEIVTGSRVTGATPDGVIMLASGETARADLVVGADGVRSAVRESLGLTRRITPFRDGCDRHLIPRLPDDPVDRMAEHWQVGRRVGIAPVSAEELYVYMCTRVSDTAGRSTIIDKEAWSHSFPQLHAVIERLPAEGRWASFTDVRCSRWSRGRAVLVGDAAHAMSPNLGQGACSTMANGHSLAYAMRATSDVEAALATWEDVQRPITDSVQRYSRLIGDIASGCPRYLTDLRSLAFSTVGRSRWWLARTSRAARRVSPLVRPTAGS